MGINKSQVTRWFTGWISCQNKRHFAQTKYMNRHCILRTFVARDLKYRYTKKSLAQTRCMNRPRVQCVFSVHDWRVHRAHLPFSCHILSYRFRQVLDCSSTCKITDNWTEKVFLEILTKIIICCASLTLSEGWAGKR